jgi:putative ABC transport system permease protein
MTELRQILRSLGRTPAFTAIAIVTLGFGIGLNTTMVSLLDALLFRLSPFTRPEELHRIEGIAADGSPKDLSVPEIEAISAALEGVAKVVPFRWVDAALNEPGAPAENYVAVATAGQFFETFEVPAALGRYYTAEEIERGDRQVAVLGHDLWQRRFGGDANVVGRSVRLNGQAVTIVGVMPPSFSYRMLWALGELWLPGDFMQRRRDNLEGRQHAVAVRLEAGVSLNELNSRLQAVTARFAAEHPRTHSQHSFRARPLHETTVGATVRHLSYLVTGIAVVVLVLICTNLANLQLSRALAMHREHAVRAALGASPSRLFRRQLAESLMIGGAGGVLGCTLALWANSALSEHLVIGLNGRLDLQLNLPVLITSVVLTLLASIASGTAPGLLASRADVNEALKQQSRGATASRGHHKLRRALVVFQIALALTLLNGAGTLIQSFQEFLQRPMGWNTREITFGTVALPHPSYPERADARRFQERLEVALRQQPGVTHAALSSLPPLASYWVTLNFLPEDRAGKKDGTVSAFYVPASHSYFETIGASFVEGGPWHANIRPESPGVVVINESLARALWPGESALGRRLGDIRGGDFRQIVGVIRDVDFPASFEEPTTPFQVYQPYTRDPWTYITIAVRGPGGFVHLSDAIRKAVASIDPSLAVQQLTDVPRSVAEHQRNLQLIVRALTLFAVAGLCLAAIGVYGVVAHAAAQRRSEFGIRLALGATPSAVSALVVGQGSRLAIAGVLCGFAGAWGIGRVLEATLPRITDAGLAVPLAVAALIGIVSVFASWLPALRAARVNPIIALRSE